MKYNNRNISNILKERIMAELDWLVSLEGFQLAQIAALPKGSIVKRNTKGERNFSLQFIENGERRYIYINEVEAKLYEGAPTERKQRIQLLRGIHIYISNLRRTLAEMETTSEAAAKKAETKKETQVKKTQERQLYRSLPYNQKLPVSYPGKNWLSSISVVTNAPPLHPENLRFQTLGGDKVRSKLEQAVADNSYDIFQSG